MIILHLYNMYFRLVSSLQQLILYLLHLYYRSFRLVSSLQQVILYYMKNKLGWKLGHLPYQDFVQPSSINGVLPGNREPVWSCHLG